MVRATATELYGDVVHANGIALSPDGRTLYHSDTRAGVVIVHSLRDDGTATERRTIDTSAYAAPDGMALDDDGCVWIALLEYGIGRFTPDGVLDRRVEVPSTLTTSVCFDGKRSLRRHREPHRRSRPARLPAPHAGRRHRRRPVFPGPRLRNRG